MTLCIFQISYFVDDGLLLAQGKKDETMLEILKIGAEEVGLRINKEITQVTIYNMKDKPESIGGIFVKDKMKYLGVNINNTRNLFKNCREEKIALARKIANMIYKYDQDQVIDY